MCAAAAAAAALGAEHGSARCCCCTPRVCGWVQALEKTGSVLGGSPLRVLPSKTAIMPVNRELMPRSNDEIERCSRTVYAANIDKKVDRNDVRAFFESLCGKPAGMVVAIMED